MTTETTNTYEIQSNHLSTDGKMRTLTAFSNIKSERVMVKNFFYLRIANPESNFALLINGYIASTKELAELAKHLLG